MAAPSQSSVRNRILAGLPADEFARIAPHIEHVDLPKGMLLVRHGHEVTSIYFIESGIGSVVATSVEGNRAEAGLLGREGYLPVWPVAGVLHGIHEVGMQLAGDGYRMDAGVFLRLLPETRNFETLLIRSMLGFSVQLAYTALSNAVHSVEERLARWLLMCHDRVDGNEIALTHEFIALMLAVRRPSVTTALHVLEGNGFVRSERGLITIRNRAAMEEFAYDVYGKAEEEYRLLMNPALV